MLATFAQIDEASAAFGLCSLGRDRDFPEPNENSVIKISICVANSENTLLKVTLNGKSHSVLMQLRVQAS